MPESIPDAVGRERQEVAGPPRREVKGGSSARIRYVVLSVWLVFFIGAIVASAGGAFGKFGTTGFYAGVGVSSGGFLIGAILLGILCVYRRTSLSLPAGQLPESFQTFVEEMSGVTASMSNWSKITQNTHFRMKLKHCWARAIKTWFGERRLGHEYAKTCFKELSKKVFCSEVTFISPSESSFDVKADMTSEQLDPCVFKLTRILGVSDEIKKIWQDEESDDSAIHLFQTESRGDGTGTSDSFITEVGDVMKMMTKYMWQNKEENDALRTSPMQLETINCCLSHGGFDMLRNVLRDSPKLNKKSCLLHRGFLYVNHENIEEVFAQVSSYYHKAEFPCFGLQNPERLGSWDQEGARVYLILQTCPNMCSLNIGRNLTVSDYELAQDVQKIIAFRNCSAVLEHALDLSKEGSKKTKSIIVHLTALGGKTYKNSSTNLAWGLKKAGLLLQKRLKDAGIKVHLDYVDRIDVAANVGRKAGLVLDD